MAVRLSTCVQHHPKRPYLLQPLIASLTPGPPPQVVFDPEPDNPFPSPWRTYRRALETTPEWATHRLVVQDDATACRDFPLAAQRALAARPEALVVFCVLGAPSHWITALRASSDRGEHWAELRVAFWQSWIPAVAVAWPRPLIRPLLDWVDEQDYPAGMRADDAIIGLGAAALGMTVLATVPSLVNHEDVVESAVGRRAAGGRNPDRTAPCFVGGSCDPLAIDWARGPG